MGGDNVARGDQKPRRIDALLCPRNSLKQKVTETTQKMEGCIEFATHEIERSLDELIKALQDRKEQLLKDAETLAKSKTRMLTDQVHRVEQHSAQELRMLGDASSDLAMIRLRTDEVISFKPKKMKELSELIKSFGVVDGTSTYASESRAKGPLIEGPVKVGHGTWLKVSACDLYGKQRKEPGDRFQVEFSDDKIGPAHFHWEIDDNEDGSYTLRVIPEAVGKYTLKLSILNPDGKDYEEVKGSVFDIAVMPPFDYSMLGDKALGQAGVPWIADDAGFLRHPFGVKFDPMGEYVFVADQCNDRLQVFEFETRKVVTSMGKKGIGPTCFDTPGHIVVDRNDRVIVSDILNHRLQVLSFNRKNHGLSHIRTIGGSGTEQGRFRFPRGIALSESGMLVVCDSGNDRMQVLDSNNDFAFVRQFGEHGIEDGKLDKPLDVVVNSRDEVVVTDERNRVQVFDLNGSFMFSFGKKGRKSGMFKGACALTVDNEDTIFICDQGNHRVQVFDKNGNFIKKWGGHLVKVGETDGETPEDPASRSNTPVMEGDDAVWFGLLCPVGITVSPSGAVLVSDYSKHLIYDFYCKPMEVKENEQQQEEVTEEQPDTIQRYDTH
mmetsp:Transcript_91101/g.161395  ORF Transcript_91101/g.161395 Transcript_91101/m.161395 type:complete len:607 (+) Transcript_91101:55-1875(+)